MSPEPSSADAWVHLRRFTSARIALGRSGGSVPTRAQLSFALDQALARDAVLVPFDAEALAVELRPMFAETFVLDSAARDRTTYLQRPDLGRELCEDSRRQLAARGETTPSDLVVVVSNGLSASAAHRHAPPLLAELLPRLRAADFSVAPLCVVRNARVALMDEIGARFHARLALMLLGERPGLGAPDSLGAYFVFDPRSDRTNADRNCVSNIRPAGLPPIAAAGKLAALLQTARALKLSGIGLKDPDQTLVRASASVPRFDP